MGAGVVLGVACEARAQYANFWIAADGDGTASFPTNLPGMFQTSLTTTDGCINNTCDNMCYTRDDVPANATLALTALPVHQYVLRAFYSASAQVKSATVFHDGNETPASVTTPEGDIVVNVADTLQYTVVVVFGAGSSSSSNVLDVCNQSTTTTTGTPGTTTSTTLPLGACGEATAPACAGSCAIGETCAAGPSGCACRTAVVVGRVAGGDITVRRSDGTVEIGVPRTDFYEGDVLESGTGALVVLSDGSFVRVAPGSKLVPRVGVAPGGGGIIGLIKGVIRVFVKPNPNTPRLEVQTQNVSVQHTGTVYDVGYDDVTLTSAVGVDEGSVEVTPTDDAIAPFPLAAGNRVEVGPAGVGAVTTVSVTCTPQSGTSKKAGKPLKVKVRCTNAAETAKKVTITGVDAETCTLRKPVSKTIKAGRTRPLKAKVKCTEAGEFFALTIDGLSD
jgi:hypothetical protein